MRLSPGARLGPYEVLSVLGSGGMGEVYLARDHRLDRRVAIKARQVGTAASAADRARVLREGRAAARLTHPCIASIYDVIEEDDTAYLVMEYVDGPTLRNALRDGALPHDRAIDLGLDLCDALAAAHDHLVVHGDIKPENLCLTTNGRLKVLDFGIARMSVDASSATVTSTSGEIDVGRHAGTPQYMAPEQFEGHPASIRTDIYAASAVLFEMLTGRPPHRGRNALEIGLQALKDEAPRADAFQPAVPAAVADVVAAGLNREPGLRPGSASELAFRLKATRTTANAAPVISAAAAGGQRSRRAPMWLATAAVLLALAGWGAWRWTRGSPLVSSQGQPLPVVAILPLDTVGVDQRHAFLGVGIADTLIANLASVPGVVVVSRADSAPYASQRGDLRRVARELGATLVVDGSLQTSGDAVRVAITLVRADASVAWGSSYEGRLDQVFDLYPPLTNGLADALTLRLSAPERRRLERPPTVNGDALAAYTGARERLDRRDLAGNLAMAIEGFERAIALDPTFALAHAGLSEAYHRDFRITGSTSAIEKAAAAAETAARIDQYGVATRISLCTIDAARGRLREAEAACRQALALQPDSDAAFRQLAGVLSLAGRQSEADEAFRRAIALRPGYWDNHHAYGSHLYASGRLDEAAAVFRRVIELQPDGPRGHQALGTVYQTQDRLDEALAEYQKAAERGSGPYVYSNMGTIEHWNGRYREAIAYYDKAIAEAPDDPILYRNKGDSLQRLGEAGAARAAYSRAMRLIEEQRRASALSTELAALRAVLLVKLGRVEEGRAEAKRLAAEHPEDSEAQYQLAIASALSGQAGAAREALDRAFALGFSRSLAAHDDDLGSVRR
jgi:serine/threonine-protein kinase